jgi:hypothetical protein
LYKYHALLIFMEGNCINIMPYWYLTCISPHRQAMQIDIPTMNVWQLTWPVLVTGVSIKCCDVKLIPSPMGPSIPS